MCRIYADQHPSRYDCETRSLRIHGHATSVRLERAYWSLVEEMAAAQGMSVSRFLSTLYDEVLDLHGEPRNFTSLIRCACLIHLENRTASIVAHAT